MGSEAYDDLDRHLQGADDMAAAAVPTGMYLAWCANLHLLEESFQQDHEALLLRLRYREITGAEFFIAGCGGNFKRSMLNRQGQQFTDAYYSRYLADFSSAFDASPYEVKDDWDHYDVIAPVLMRNFMARDDHSPRKWWLPWR